MISIIIPVYNNTDRLYLCLDSIIRNTFTDFEIIVLDNDSSPPVNLDNYRDDYRIRLILEKTPGSYAARNTGIVNAAGHIIGFTDSDCIVEPDWIENAVSALDAYPNAGFIGGNIRMYAEGKNSLNSIEKYELYFSMNQEKYIKYANFAATANMWARRCIIEKVGFFNTKLMSSGDKEWGNRVVNAGYKGVYVDNVIVNHPVRSNVHDFKIKNLRIGAGFYDISLSKIEVLQNLYKLIIIGKHRIIDLFSSKKLKVNEKTRIIFIILLERIYTICGFILRMFTKKQYR